MTPLDHDLIGSERGAADKGNAKCLHDQSAKLTDSNPMLSPEKLNAVPKGKKKRARRRHRGKNGVLNAVLSSAKDELLTAKKSRSQKKPLFVSTANTFAPDENTQQQTCNNNYANSFFEKDKVLPLYAALDLGTNNCRLLIATPTKPGHFRVVDAFSRIVRLGEGLGRSGQLNANAMQRAIEALKVCGAKLKQKDIRSFRLIATEACRSAINGQDFLQRVFDETGLKLEVVDRQTEARLAVSGCGTLVEHNTDAIVLFDIGGGSSEIALIDISHKRSPHLAEHITAWTSLPVGVVTLAERFGGENVSVDDYEDMKKHVRELLSDFSDRFKLGDLATGPHFHLLGTSGTVTTLAGLHLDLDRYDRKRIDGMWMKNEDVTRMTERLLSWNLAERVANPCIGQDRADLVLAGCAILDAIREVWPSERLRVADRGLREGILTELMSRDGAWRRRRPRPFNQYRSYKNDGSNKQ